MAVKVTGERELFGRLDKVFGKENVERISDKALIAGGEVFIKELKAQFETFKDTGASIREITLSDPYTVGSERVVTVHWKGKEDRYRIIHLNEFGTVQNPNPAGKGAIARAMRNAEKEYIRTVKREMEALTRG